ncbi:uncharacterized protein ANIA_11394 [Aspergillus nidulans FGSC A4]|uniref:Uncharacterized protein n=1 Tax=Emericella nidulans (strain FGSC A4 / ATCC 38163 / CBS 112.46 / NRRL 194 / M139) TaxID=227321 RepID=C8VHM4_EMENI|nr:hypothetical protein [Aspergillus nidulans FGSC A4]CBF82789.1 TPA: hypothetical protein ANIA_11394 [Aspergillus nidulans FGSC A4]
MSDKDTILTVWDSTVTNSLDTEECRSNSYAPNEMIIEPIISVTVEEINRERLAAKVSKLKSI